MHPTPRDGMLRIAARLADRSDRRPADRPDEGLTAVFGQFPDAITIVFNPTHSSSRSSANPA